MAERRTMLFNPYNGLPRHPNDIASDPTGALMVDPDEPLFAARSSKQQDRDAERLDWLDTHVKHWGTGDGGHQHLLRMAWDSGIPGLHRTHVRDAIDAARATQAQGEKGGAT